MGDHGLCLTTLMGVAVGGRDGCQGNGGIVLGCSDGEMLHWHTPLCTQSMHVVLNGRRVRSHLTLAQLGVRHDAVLVATQIPIQGLRGGAGTLREFLATKDPATTTVIEDVPNDVTGK